MRTPPLLSFHGRIPRRPASRWLEDLQRSVRDIQRLDTSASERFDDTLVIFNQFALVLFLMRNRNGAERVLALQSRFLDQVANEVEWPRIVAARCQIDINKVRILRATGASDEAIFAVRSLLHQQGMWRDLSQYNITLHESVYGDVTLELCKLFLHRGGAQLHQVLEELYEIAGQEHGGRNLRTAAIECAGILLLRHKEIDAFGRLIESDMAKGDARELLQTRKLSYVIRATPQPYLIGMMPLFLDKIKKLSIMGGEYIDHLIYIDFIRDIFAAAGMRELEIEALRALEKGARSRRDLPLFCYSKSRLQLLESGHESDPNKHYFPNGAFPIFKSASDRVQVMIDRLFESLP